MALKTSFDNFYLSVYDAEGMLRVFEELDRLLGDLFPRHDDGKARRGRARVARGDTPRRFADGHALLAEGERRQIAELSDAVCGTLSDSASGRPLPVADEIRNVPVPSYRSDLLSGGASCHRAGAGMEGGRTLSASHG